MKQTPAPDLIQILQDAIGKLKKYSTDVLQQHAASPLQKTIHLFKTLIVDKKRHQIEVLQAVDTIHRKRLFIQKLKSGNRLERDLAEELAKTIETYNQRQAGGHAAAEDNVFKRFFNVELQASHQLPTIDLPTEHLTKFQYPSISYSPTLKRKTAPLTDSNETVQLSMQYRELFQMKALALLERYGIASNPEARAFVKNAPIFTRVEVDEATCTLAQKLQIFPGQVIVITGSSELDPQTQTINKLFPETFFVSLESSQTGFPHPSQRFGWSLADELLPQSLQRPDQTQTLGLFFQRKKTAGEALLPQGKLLQKAKRLLKLKSQAFRMNCSESLELHRSFFDLLQKEFFKSYKSEYAQRFDPVCIHRFYDDLHCHPNAFDQLVDAHQKACELFIGKPYQKLLEAIVDPSSGLGSQKEASASYAAASAILEEALKSPVQAPQSLKGLKGWESSKWEYIESVGGMMGIAAGNVILQYLSEDLEYAPPALIPFERKIQSAAYQHAKTFIEELDLEWSDDEKGLEACYRRCKQSILDDVAIFSNDKPLWPCDELASYFETRYQVLHR